MTPKNANSTNKRHFQMSIPLVKVMREQDVQVTPKLRPSSRRSNEGRVQRSNFVELSPNLMALSITIAPEKKREKHG
jgi:hypothetical protein